MIEIANADRGMIQDVVSRLRADDAAEMAAAGTDLDMLPGQIMRHRVFAYCAWDYDCGPISVWGLVQKRHGVGAGFAFGTNDWGRAVLPMVRQIRGFVLPLLVDLGLHRVEAVALRRRDDVRRFMSLIGAKAEGVLPATASMARTSFRTGGFLMNMAVTELKKPKRTVRTPHIDIRMAVSADADMLAKFLGAFFTRSILVEAPEIP